MLEIISVTVIVLFVLALQIVKLGAKSDLQYAVKKCRNCKYHTGYDAEHRYLYCNGYAITPGESRECNHFEKIGDKDENN